MSFTEINGISYKIIFIEMTFFVPPQVLRRDGPHPLLPAQGQPRQGVRLHRRLLGLLAGNWWVCIEKKI